MSEFKYISLFSGIGGFETGLDNINGECVFASEINKHATTSYKAIHGDINLHGDITKIDEAKVPDHDMLVGGFPCFAQGTLITTSQGLKKIEDIKKGDKVLTHANEFKEVVIPMIKSKKGIYTVKIQGSPITYVTEEHPYYVREMKRKWNGELKKQVRVLGDPEWVEAKDLLNKKYFVGLSENSLSENPLEITEEEAWLLGRYLADGYIQDGKRAGRENSYNHKVVFCIGKHKLGDFKKEIKTYHLGITEERTAYKTRIINERFYRLALLCGKGSENKEFPFELLSLPKTLLEKAIEGYLSGDGSSRGHTYSANSVSQKLIFSLGQAVQKAFNTPYSISFTKRPKTTYIEGRLVNQKDTWTIRFSKETKKQNNGIYDGGMLWMPVKSLVYDEDWIGNVHNFEVEEDNSYTANNTIVHNCQTFSTNGKRKGFEDARGTLFFEALRIAKEKKSKAIFLENVTGLVNHDKGRTLDVMINALSEIGYVVDFDILNSSNFGVPQSRDRIYIIGVRNDLIESEEWKINGTTAIPKAKRRLLESGNVNTFNFKYPLGSDKRVELKDILESNVNESYYLDDDLLNRLTFRIEGEEGIAVRQATKIGYDIAYTGDAVNFVFPESKTRRGRVGKQRANTLEASNINQGVVTEDYRIRKLTPLETWRLQGFSDEQFYAAKSTGMTDKELYKQSGNAVTVNVIEAIGRELLKVINKQPELVI